MISLLNWIAVLTALVTSVGLLLHHNWRWGLVFMAIQYLCVFWLIQTHWPVSMAATKLVTGWMACVILGMAWMNVETSGTSEESWLQGRLFRIFSAGIILAATFALSLKVATSLGLGLPIAWGSLLLIGMGLLQLGINDHPFRVIIGLLTTLSGFEILYATIESSILVAASLAVINLGLALTGAFFIYSIKKEES